MTHRSIPLVLAALLAAAANAQITVRDTIVALPPVSICQDGATHVTVCTNHRLRPGAVGNLSQFVGQPLEITGTPGAITCQFVTVQSVTVLANMQLATTSVSTTTMTVDFFGAGPAGDVFLLFLGASMQATPTSYPPYLGPVHLDPAFATFVGVFAPQGLSTPYFSLTFPLNPAAIGITFFDQALAVHSGGIAETSVVDCFQF